MKKPYSKPNILFESFTPSTSIAGTCEKDINTFSNGECGVRFGRKTVFTEEVTGCNTKVIDGSEDYDGLCYHVPVDTNNVFMS